MAGKQQATQLLLRWEMWFEASRKSGLTAGMLPTPWLWTRRVVKSLDGSF